MPIRQGDRNDMCGAMLNEQRSLVTQSLNEIGAGLTLPGARGEWLTE